jgi:hypothetical protein
MEHRAVGICPGFDEVEHEGRGERELHVLLLPDARVL